MGKESTAISPALETECTPSGSFIHVQAYENRILPTAKTAMACSFFESPFLHHRFEFLYDSNCLFMRFFHSTSRPI